MSADQPDTSRAAFEAWLNQAHPNTRSLADVLDKSEQAIAEGAWSDAWQASRKAALEEAAKVSDLRSLHPIVSEKIRDLK